MLVDGSPSTRFWRMPEDSWSTASFTNVDDIGDDVPVLEEVDSEEVDEAFETKEDIAEAITFIVLEEDADEVR
jgi:hypothetical protein